MRIALSTFGFAALVMTASIGCGDSSEGAGGAGGTSTSVTSATGQTVSGTTTGTSVTSTGVTSTVATGGGDAPTVTLTLSSDTVAAGGSLMGTVAVTNFILEAPVNQPNQAGHGHFHIYLDGASGGNYLLADQVPAVTIKIPANTTAGAHTLKVSLSDNHHTPLNPPVEDVVNITVQ